MELGRGYIKRIQEIKDCLGHLEVQVAFRNDELALATLAHINHITAIMEGWLTARIDASHSWEDPPK